MKKLILALSVTAFAVRTTLPVAAADAQPAAEPKTALTRPRQSSGKITSLDTQTKTLKIEERVFHVTSATRFTKDKKPAAFEDAKVGEEVVIFYRESDDKKLNIVILRIGPKPEAVPKKETPAK